MGHSIPMPTRFFAVAALLLAAFGSASSPSAIRAATGRADVRLVRLLDEVPDSDHTTLGPVKDIRLRLEPGNLVVFKQRGVVATIFPIERAAGGTDSLRYAFFLERPNTFWIFPGANEKGIRTVLDGGTIQVNSFRVIWRSGSGPGRALGWLYFPDAPENEGLAFSVVSGRTVGRADPKDAKYWIELGAPGAASASGF